MENTREEELKQEAEVISEAVMANLQAKKKEIMVEIEEHMEKHKHFVVVYETLFASFLSDVITFGALIGVLAINHVKFDDSTFGAWMLGIMFFVILTGKSKNIRMTKVKGKQALAEYLEQLKKEITK